MVISHYSTGISQPEISFPFPWDPDQHEPLPWRAPAVHPAKVAVTDAKIQLDRVDEEDRSEGSESLNVAIGQNWTRLAFSGLSDGVYERLLKLARKAPGWRGAGSKPLSGASLQCFLQFWKLVREAASGPELALAPNGNLQGEWHKNWRKHLDLEFTDSGLVYFGLFDGMSVVEGVDPAKELAETLLHRSSKPLTWTS